VNAAAWIFGSALILALGLTQAQAACTVAEPIRCFAVSETTEAGVVTEGSLADLHETDSFIESFDEQDATIVPPPKRADLVQHTWTIEVAPGNSYSFTVAAYRVDAGGEGDDFNFLYSADGGQNWAIMVIVDADSLATYAYDFTTDVGGTLLVRAEDADRVPASGAAATSGSLPYRPS
jgi:hypothetical protein